MKPEQTIEIAMPELVRGEFRWDKFRAALTEQYRQEGFLNESQSEVAATAATNQLKDLAKRSWDRGYTPRQALLSARRILTEAAERRLA